MTKLLKLSKKRCYGCLKKIKKNEYSVEVFIREDDSRKLCVVCSITGVSVRSELQEDKAVRSLFHDHRPFLSKLN